MHPYLFEQPAGSHDYDYVKDQLKTDREKSGGQKERALERKKDKEKDRERPDKHVGLPKIIHLWGSITEECLGSTKVL